MAGRLRRGVSNKQAASALLCATSLVTNSNAYWSRSGNCQQPKPLGLWLLCRSPPNATARLKLFGLQPEFLFSLASFTLHGFAQVLELCSHVFALAQMLKQSKIVRIQGPTLAS